MITTITTNEITQVVIRALVLRNILAKVPTKEVMKTKPESTNNTNLIPEFLDFIFSINF